DAQYDEWESLFSISVIEATLENGGDKRSVEWLKANPFLVLDTKHFDDDFKDRLLARIEDLDEKTDGLLVESENFQALNLMQARYRERVKCIYIDPPYNTGKDEFLYKDNYQHSSWLSMMDDRLRFGRGLLSNDGAIFVNIDDQEAETLRLLLDGLFGEENFVTQIEWQKRYTRSNNTNTFTSVIDHIPLYCKERPYQPNLLDRGEEADARYSNPDHDPRGPWKAIPFVNPLSPSQRPNLSYPIFNPNTGEEILPKRKAWRSSQSVFEGHMADNRVWWGQDGKSSVPNIKRFLSEVK
ncbi:MAG: site-specific DNA-methyltransferase, partial [Rubrobacter sp.]|nr:site-specific DNA-methyltransferase [Rubrobacter sp.]